MTSSILDDKFPKDMLYDVLLCVFGSTCFVHDLSPGQINCMHELSNVCFWSILKLKRGICVILFLHIVFIYQ